MHYTILFPIFGSFRKPNIHLVTNPQGKVTNTACQCHKHSMSVSLLQYVSVTPFTRGEFKVSAFTSPKGPIKFVVLCKIKTYAPEGVFIGKTFLFFPVTTVSTKYHCCTILVSLCCVVFAYNLVQKFSAQWKLESKCLILRHH